MQPTEDPETEAEDFCEVADDAEQQSRARGLKGNRQLKSVTR